MSQNRQAAVDRLEAKGDYDINVKSELEIELLHQKIDQMREAEISQLLALVEGLVHRLTTVALPRPVSDDISQNA
jgi:uncharacterized membrane protein